MKMGSMLIFLKGVLHKQAIDIDVKDITQDYAYQFWALTIEAVNIFAPDLKGLGTDLGKIFAYRLEHDKEFREKVRGLLEKAKKINIPAED